MMEYPGVGVGVYIRKDGKVLCGLRKGKVHPETWSVPGGKIDMYEHWEECARRETLEETGLKVGNLRFMAMTHDVDRPIGTHYVTLHFAADIVGGELQLTEPDKFERWEWFAWDALPEPLFHPMRRLVETGINPCEM